MVDESELIDGLRSGVRRTREFMDMLTEYHGGPAETEYLLTSDIAREFLQKGHEVRVEALNRHFCSTLASKQVKAARSALGSKRTDVAIGQDIMPDALVEVKIRIDNISGLRKDLEKITDTIRFMTSHRHRKILAASVFQMHIRATKKRWKRNHFLTALNAFEEKFGVQLEKFGQSRKDFLFSLVDLQSNRDEGVVDFSYSEEPSGSKVIDADGHVTRYYAVLIKHIDHGKPSLPTEFRNLRPEQKTQKRL